MTRDERNQLLADLRAAGVQEYVGDQHGLVRVVFFPARDARPTVQAAPSEPEPEGLTTKSAMLDYFEGAHGEVTGGEPPAGLP